VSTVVALLLLVLSELLHRSILLDLALTVAVFTVAGGLVFARYLERWL
jgi:multisubunit Na+/H+ antiporter MnhF subunit